MGFFSTKFIDPSVNDKGVKFFSDDSKSEWLYVAPMGSTNPEWRKLASSQGELPEGATTAEAIDFGLKSQNALLNIIVKGWGSTKYREGKIEGSNGKAIEYSPEALDLFVSGIPREFASDLLEFAQNYNNFTRDGMEQDAKN